MTDQTDKQPPKKTGDNVKPAPAQASGFQEGLLRILEQMARSPPEPPRDMKNHKFWSTQPVPAYDEKTNTDGAIKQINPEKVPKKPSALLDGFEWATVDIEDPDQLSEVYTLLEGHYVEDRESKFRFNYSREFLKWALMAPGWEDLKELFIGVRSTKTKALLAFISGIPVTMRIRENSLRCSEINFLCVHKKLRSLRLAPVLIAEVTRRSYVNGIFQGVYTAGRLLPTPISTCRYYHRSINWERLNKVGFAELQRGETSEEMVKKYALPDTVELPGLREATKEDIPQMADLLARYLARAGVTQAFTEEEVAHWLVGKPDERVIWSYVVEDPETKKITDLFSFYNIESKVLGDKETTNINVAYQFYYATEAAFVGKEALKKRLNELTFAVLVLCKQKGFDVYNALSLLDNPLFLDDQLFGPGDGFLHYYMFNYKAAPITGGLGKDKLSSEDELGGVGLIML